MKIRCFQDTDRLYIELRPVQIFETRDLGQDTVIDLNEQVAICAMTIEHASERADLFLRADCRIAFWPPRSSSRAAMDADDNGDAPCPPSTTSQAGTRPPGRVREFLGFNS